MKATNSNFQSSLCCAAFTPLINNAVRASQEAITSPSVLPNIMPRVGSKLGPVKPKKDAEKETVNNAREAGVIRKDSGSIPKCG